MGTGHVVLRRHNDPSRDDYIIDVGGLQQRAPGGILARSNHKIIGLSVVISTDFTQQLLSTKTLWTTSTVQRLEHNNVAVKGKYNSLGGDNPKFWDAYRDVDVSVDECPIKKDDIDGDREYCMPCGQTALFGAMIELEAPGFSAFTAEDASPTVKQVENLFRPLRRAIHKEMQNNDPLAEMILSSKLGKSRKTIEQLGTLPSGILGVIKKQLANCHGFKAQVYITKDCLKNHPIFKKCKNAYNYEVVEDLPTLLPFQRSLEWTIKPARPITPLEQTQRRDWQNESMEWYKEYLKAIAKSGKRFEDYFITATVVEDAKAIRPWKSARKFDVEVGTTFQALYLKGSKHSWAAEMVVCARFCETYGWMICHVMLKKLKFETGQAQRLCSTDENRPHVQSLMNPAGCLPETETLREDKLCEEFLSDVRKVNEFSDILDLADLPKLIDDSSDQISESSSQPPKSPFERLRIQVHAPLSG